MFKNFYIFGVNLKYEKDETQLVPVITVVEQLQ